MQRRLSGPARHSDGGEAKRGKGDRRFGMRSQMLFGRTGAENLSARNTRRPGGGRPSRLDFFSPGRLPFPSNVMGYGWSRLRCMGSGSRTRVRAVRREELPHGVGAYFAAESRSGSDGGAEASEIGISVCASSPARIRPPCRRGRANGGKPGCGPVVSDRLPGQKDRSIRFRLRPGP